MKLISIVVPMFNEEEMAPIFIKRVSEVLKSLKEYSYEIVAVNDGSRDNTLNILKSEQDKDNHIVIVNLSRNWGHESALYAGLKTANGDCAIPMDADLQDPPELIPEMIKMWEDGYQIVNARRSSRKEDTYLKRSSAGTFYKWANKISKKVKIPANVANFRLIDRRPLDEVLKMQEKSRVFRVEVPYVGFKVGEVLFQRPKRQKGVSKYNVSSMVSLAIDSTVSLTNHPLDWTVGSTIALGTISFISLVTELVFFILHLTKVLSIGEINLWFWLIINILLILSTGIMFSIAIVAQYLGRTLIETRNRPAVIIDEVIKK